MTRYVKTRSTKIAAAILISLIAASCTDSSSSTTTSSVVAEQPTYGGALKVGIFDTFPGFCVGNNPANSALMAARTVYETLFERSKTGTMVGLLAKSGTSSADLKTWTITLREGITFHDGLPFNAEAVVANFNAITGRIAAGAYASGGAAGLGAVAYTIGTGTAFTTNILNFTAISEYQVVFTLDRPQNDFLSTLYASGRFFMRSPAQLASAKVCANEAIGTGPFVLDSWNPSQMIVTKNANYWRRDLVTQNTLPYLDKITFSNVKESTQRSAGVRTSALDAAMFASASEAATITDLRGRTSDVTEFRSAADYYPSLWLNQGRPNSPFAFKSARQAVLSCLDRTNYKKIRLGGEGVIATSIVGTKSSMYSTVGFPAFDPDAAKGYVSIYKTQSGKNTLTFSFPADTSSASQANARFLKNTWKTCGITANIITEETALIIAKAFNSSPSVADGEYYNAYDMVPLLLLEGNDAAFNVPFLVSNSFSTASKNPLKPLFSTSIGAVLNLTHHSDTRIDDLLYAGQGAVSLPESKAQFAVATEYIQEEAVLGALVHVYYSMFTTKDLGGVGSIPLDAKNKKQTVTNWGIEWTGIYKRP